MKPCECCDHPLEHLISQALDEAYWLGSRKALENLHNGLADWRAAQLEGKSVASDSKGE